MTDITLARAGERAADEADGEADRAARARCSLQTNRRHLPRPSGKFSLYFAQFCTFYAQRHKLFAARG